MRWSNNPGHCQILLADHHLYCSKRSEVILQLWLPYRAVVPGSPLREMTQTHFCSA